ncbi:MAG: hypothetical protein KDK78_08415, partial [Chlamydiia bacterium]|nr:hypothetical protein [Chlamydiia bacterium]
MSSEPTEVEQALEEELGARLPHSADKKSSSWGKKALEGLRWDFHATDVGRAVANLKLAHKLEKAAKGDLDESRLPPHYQGRAPSDLKERAKYCRSEAFGEISRFAGKTARRILNTSNMVLSGAKLTLSIVGVGTIAGLSTVAAALTGVGAVVGLVVSTGMGIFHTSMVGIGLLRKHRLAEMKHQSNELHAKADEIESLLKGVEATGTDRLNSLAKCLNTANLREAEKAECTDLFNTKQYDQLTSTLLLNAAAPFATADQLKSWLTEAPNGNVEVQEECKALLRSEAQFMRAQATTLRDFARLHHTRTNRKIAHNLLAAAAWASAGTAAALAIISLSGMPATVTLPLSLGFSTLAIGLFASSAGVAIGSKVAMSLSQMEAQMGENDPDKPASEQSQAQTFLGVEYRAALLAQMEVERRQQRGEGQEAPVLDFVFSQFLGRKDAETFISQAADWYQARAEKQERTTEQSLKKLRNVDTWVTR